MSNINCLKPVVWTKTFDGTGEKLTSVRPCVRDFLRVFVDATAMVDSTESGEEVVDKQQPGATHVTRSMASMILIYQDRLRVHIVDTDVVEHRRIGAWKLEGDDAFFQYVALEFPGTVRRTPPLRRCAFSLPAMTPTMTVEDRSW